MAFQKNDTLNKVIEVISEKLSIPADNISETVTFKDLGADSLDIAEIIMSFEEVFGIEIKDTDAEKIKTVGDAVELIHQHRTK
ncbi:TPA: acyl carrier protein [Candidatus Dependentiae bacterium]|nr:MAG: Acyl carrier protein [candidate division TM6 bacterium GW2011_GWF2_33_332]HBS48119.1 acyl carrier protein [Candidatus Dependentiae bacterium]HBZ73543.1 acyl carrier protein [Candidatus Dependentiae bacterium]